ncbi:MAG: hypothetical protein RLY86_3144 [Pseudomonadota bacterium]|jgi:hypothetical protein
MAFEPEDEVLELTQMMPDEPEQASDPFDFSPPPPPPPRPRRMPVDEDALMSETTAEMASRALSGLPGFRRYPSIEGEGPFGRHDLTLEHLVREMVRPMIREWLDDNLPELVERLVRREIQKVVRRGMD